MVVNCKLNWRADSYYKRNVSGCGSYVDGLAGDGQVARGLA